LKKEVSSWTPAFAGVTGVVKPPINVIPAKAGIQMSTLAYYFNGLLRNM
jgi:hypothetical protein